jgi:GTPase
MSAPAPGFHSGFVSILGRSNAGKSTLLNVLVGGKLAAVSEKPQTTRTTVEGVLHMDHGQVIFMDTPGIHESDTLLNRRMMQTVRSALQDRDLLLYLADAAAPFTGQDAHALDVVRNVSTPTLLLLTKIDRVPDKRQLLPRIEQYKTMRDFAEFIPISAVTGEGLDGLRQAIFTRLPEGPAYFPPDYLTDQPERFLAAELIRERVMRETRQEVPHAVAVLVDEWKESPLLTRIAATIYVERDGQKAILIGSKGAMMKKIGTLARQEMQTLFSRKIHLEMFVKVQKDWRENPEFLRMIDWRSMRGGELGTEPNSDS